MPRKKTEVVKAPGSSLIQCIPKETMTALKEMESQCVELSGMEPGIEQVMVLGYAITKMKETLMQPEVMTMLKSLKNTPIGFKTDERKGNPDRRQREIVYGPEVIANAVIQGRMFGVYPVHNQMNIISFQCYVTKEGFEYILTHSQDCVEKLEQHWIEDLTFLRVAQAGNQQVAYIGGTVCYQLKGGITGRKEITVPVSWGKYSSADQGFGKAKRKMLAWLYEMVTGKKVADGDIESTFNPDTIEVQASVVDVPDEPANKIENPATDDQKTNIEALFYHKFFDTEEWKTRKRSYDKAKDIMDASMANKQIAGMISELKKYNQPVPDLV